MSSQDTKWYKSNTAIIALLIIFFPAGLFLMWKYSKWSMRNKTIATILVAIYTVLNTTNKTDNSTPSNLPSNTNEVPEQSEVVNFVLTEDKIYATCRQEFSDQLELSTNMPIYDLAPGGEALVINNLNSTGGRVTKLPDGKVFLAGHALIEETEKSTKTRHFICILKNNDGSMIDFVRGEDYSWGS